MHCNHPSCAFLSSPPACSDVSGVPSSSSYPSQFCLCFFFFLSVSSESFLFSPSSPSASFPWPPFYHRRSSLSCLVPNSPAPNTLSRTIDFHREPFYVPGTPAFEGWNQVKAIFAFLLHSTWGSPGRWRYRQLWGRYCILWNILWPIQSFSTPHIYMIYINSHS